MNKLDPAVKQELNREAAYNCYAYLANKVTLRLVSGETTLKAIVDNLNTCDTSKWTSAEKRQRDVLTAAVKSDPVLSSSVIGDQVSREGGRGLNACTFTDSEGNVSVVFRGTGGGEWIDNGEGLSGIPEENTYLTYNADGTVKKSATVQNDYATDQQVEALNWFNEIAAKNGWDQDTNITVSGHSKGGNKAQFVTIHSDLVDSCYSIDGQGFSPEALDAMQDMYGKDFEARRQRIYSFAAYNDYVNVLGERLAQKDQIYYFKAPIGDSNPIAYHFADAILDETGTLNARCDQGEISQYVENVSKELMRLPPEMRQYATLGAMSLFQNLMGKDENGQPATPVNGDHVSAGTTAVGMAIAGDVLVQKLLGTKGGKECLKEIVQLYSDDLASGVKTVYDDIGKKHGTAAQGGAILFSSVVVAVATPFVACTGMVLSDYVWSRKALSSLGVQLGLVDVDLYAETQKFYIGTYIKKAAPKNTRIPIKNLPAAGGPIRVNTALLREYATRLNAVQGRISGLNDRLNTLCAKEGLADVQHLLRTEVLTGGVDRLARCAGYLVETAEDFEAAERIIASQ